MINTHEALAKDNVSSSSLFLNYIKLPHVDPNCIFTSRSVIDSNVPDYLSPRKLINPIITKLNHSGLGRKNYRSFTQVDHETTKEKSKKYSQYPNKYQQLKIYTQQTERKPIKQTLYSPSEKKKQVAQKLLKITKQLGFNRADYKNYMRTDSLQETRNKKYKLNIQIDKNQNESTIVLSNKKTNINNQLSNQQKKQYQDIIQLVQLQAESIININKCNLRLKPMPKNTKFNPIKKKNIFLQQKQSIVGSMNKSIRGWTKYGKISQQFQQ